MSTVTHFRFLHVEIFRVEPRVARLNMTNAPVAGER
jgi:hypothetical protein